MILLMTLTYPGNSAKKAAELFFKKAGKLPPFIKKWLTFTSSDCSKGIKIYHLIYTEKEHAEEAITEINKLNTPFFNIEGFRSTIEILNPLSEASKLLQLM